MNNCSIVTFYYILMSRLSSCFVQSCRSVGFTSRMQTQQNRLKTSRKKTDCFFIRNKSFRAPEFFNSNIQTNLTDQDRRIGSSEVLNNPESLTGVSLAGSLLPLCDLLVYLTELHCRLLLLEPQVALRDEQQQQQ